MRDIINLILKEDEMQKFSTWAFGEDFKNLDEKDAVEAWNKRHGKIIRFKEEGIPSRDFPEMVLTWKIVA